MTSVNDLQIGSAFPVSNHMRRRNQTPSPWNQAGPSAPGKRSKLARERPRSGPGSAVLRGCFFGRDRRFRYAAICLRAPTAGRGAASARSAFPLGFGNQFLKLSHRIVEGFGSAAVQFRNPFLYIKDLGTLPATYCQKARRQTQERGRSIAAAIRSSFASTFNGTRTETGGEPTLSGNGLSEWRCVSPYDVDHWRSQFDARTLLDNASTGGTRFSASSARRVAIKRPYSRSFSAVPLNGVLDRANAS